MRSSTLSVLLLALSACGDSGGDTTSTTTGPAPGTDASTGAAESSTVDPTTGDPTTTEPGTGSAGATTTTTGEPDPTTTDEATSGELTTGDATTGDATTGDATTGDASSSGSTGDTTGGGVSELEIAIVDAELYADCMPEIAPDPAMGSWYVEFTNNGAAETSATVVKASLSLAVDMPEIEEIMVSPVDSGPLPPGETTSLEVEKLVGASHSACEHCGEFYLLKLEYQEGDVTHVVTEDVTISCAF